MSVFDELEKIKKVGLPQILVLYGEEENIVQELKDRLLEFVHYDSSDLGQAYFDLNTSNANLALEELESLPFLSLIHILRCRRMSMCRSRWSPYH